MAIDASKFRIYCRGTDLSTALQSTAIDRTRDEVDATVYTDAIRNPAALNLQRVSLAHAGIYSDGPFSIAEVLRQAAVTDEEPVTLAPEGAIVANKAWILLAHRASLTMPDGAAPGQVYRAALRATSRIGLADGVVGLNGLVNSDTQTAAYQLGAPPVGQRVIATVHLLAITPTPSVVFFLESDSGSGFASPTIQATSAAQTARGSVALSAIPTIAAPITDDWWRVRWDYSGTGDFTAVVALGLTA